jgi:hypothetical protein
MNLNLIRLLALLAQGGMVAGGVGMLADKDKNKLDKKHDSYQDYLQDEEIPIEERMQRVEDVQANKYKDSAAHKAKLQALKNLRGQ